MDGDTFETDSLCTNCKKDGTTRILLIKVPFFKDIALMAFECPHCHYKNSELQCCSKIPAKGIRYELLVDKLSDLNRTVVRSDYTTITIPHLEFEVLSGSQKGDVTTIEGIIFKAICGLKMDQDVRFNESPDTAQKIATFIEKLEVLLTMKEPFRLVVSDFSGNSFVSNPNAPKKDPNLVIHTFVRTVDQNHQLGIYDADELVVTDEETASDSGANDDGKSVDDVANSLELDNEVLKLSDNCPTCGVPCSVNMKLQKVPHFKEVIIMASDCDRCGHRSNEVKSGAGIEPKGIKITLNVIDMEDLCRDVLKSDTCSVLIPEVELDVGPTTLSGRFTTVEGLLVGVKDQLQQNIFTDSMESSVKKQLDEFLQRMADLITGKHLFTLILDDPAGNSYVQSKEETPDEQLKIEYYERNYAQNDELGLNDMKTENYKEK